MGVDLGRRDVAVAEQLLDCTNVLAALEQVGGEAVAQRVAGGSLLEARPTDGVGDRALNDGLMEMVPIRNPACTVCSGGGEEPAPVPGALRCRVLAGQGIGTATRTPATKSRSCCWWARWS